MKRPLPIQTDTSLLALTLPWRQAGHDSLSVVVKATLDMVADGDATLAAETDSPCGDLPAGDPLHSSLLYPSDLGLLKPRCDVVLHGHAYPTKPGASTSFLRFELSRKRNALFRRQIAVIGPRHWEADIPSTPKAFKRIPLHYEHAFGGPEINANPIGVGLMGERLPNLEDPDQLLRRRGDKPAPAGVSAIPMGWPLRWGKLGSYDESWKTDHYPHFPPDFDWSFYQFAPATQQIDELFGDERFILAGVHPEHDAITGKLCAPRPRCFGQRGADGTAIFELKLRLDTLVFLPDDMKVNLIWRAVIYDPGPIDELLLLCDAEDSPAITLETAHLHWQRLRQPLSAIGTSPATSHANDGSPPLGMEQEAAAIAETLRAAGVSRPAKAAEQPLPRRDEASQRERAFAARRRVEKLIERGEALTALDAPGAELAGLDLRGQSLIGANLKGARLVGCNFSAADLSMTQLAGADLSDALLDRAKLDLADLTGACLERTSLVAASLIQTDFTDVNGKQAQFKRASGSHCCFCGGDWSRARFDGADLSDADFSRAIISGANFEGANLRNIRLYEARGDRVSFGNASLIDARADGVMLDKASLVAINAPGSTWDGATLTACDFHNAVIPQASLSDAHCERANFSGANLTSGRLMRTILRDAKLIGCNLFEALLESSDLSNADLRGANLYGAETYDANVQAARLTDAIITHTKLKR